MQLPHLRFKIVATVQQFYRELPTAVALTEKSRMSRTTPVVDFASDFLVLNFCINPFMHKIAPLTSSINFCLSLGNNALM